MSTYGCNRERPFRSCHPDGPVVLAVLTDTPLLTTCDSAATTIGCRGNRYAPSPNIPATFNKLLIQQRIVKDSHVFADMYSLYIAEQAEPQARRDGMSRSCVQAAQTSGNSRRMSR